MFDTIWQDLKREYRTGNMVTRIILVCVAIFISVALIRLITKGANVSNSAAYTAMINYLSIAGDPIQLLKQPWSIFTHMFLHEDVWHLVWNMLWLYIFGRIVGDLLGDQRVLPLYILGGLAGALFFLVYSMAFGLKGYALGASAAVSAVVFAAAFTSPDYMIRLILLGNIPIKYIAAFHLVMDILSLGSGNTGGHVAHLGGAAMGAIFVLQLRRGLDLTEPLQSTILWWKSLWSQSDTTRRRASSYRESQSRRSIKIVHSQKKRSTTRKASSPAPDDMQTRMDKILDKINATGMSSLSDEERDFLQSFGK